VAGVFDQLVLTVVLAKQEAEPPGLGPLVGVVDGRRLADRVGAHARDAFDHMTLRDSQAFRIKSQPARRT